MKFLKQVLLVLGMMVLAGCNLVESDNPSESEGLQVVTTFYPVYEFTKQVVGDQGTVTMLVGAGQDTHGFEPTPKDMVAIAEADVFIYSSAYMETWVPAVLDTLADSEVLVIEAGESVSYYEDEHAEDDDHGHNHIVDPHIWLDPIFAQEMVAMIENGIQQADPTHEAVYAENAASFQEELSALDEAFKTAFQGAENRTFVVQHAAFGYLARRYDLEEVAISSLTSSQEVSPSQIAEIGRFMQEENLSVIYYQDSANAQLAETLVKEINGELEQLSAIEGIPTDLLEQGVDYLSVMRQNITALQKTIH